MLAFAGKAFCADASKWTLAAEKFTLPQKNVKSVAIETASKTMPSLILEQIAENLKRTPRAQEQLDRSLYDFQKERISLFLQLSKEVQARDSIFLNDYSESRLKLKLKEADKKVFKIEKQISDNLEKAESEKQKYAPEIQKDLERIKKMSSGEDVDRKKNNSFASFFKDFIPGKNDFSFKPEDVVLYKNDSTQLFKVDDSARDAGYSSYEFEKACVDAKINGLLTGTVTVYGMFVSVSVNLYQFPGSRIIGSATDVGSLDELKTIATNISMQLAPKVADSMPVELKLSVSPVEAAEEITITVDDVVYKEALKNIILQSGVHTLTFSSPGFETVSTSYAFQGSREFSVDVAMNEKTTGHMQLRMNKPYSGDLFVAGDFSGHIDETSPFGTIKVNNRNLLGHFVTDDGKTADFVIPKSLVLDEAYLYVTSRPFDTSSYIEKRRKLMYTSYSILIVSLLPTFYTYGYSYGTAKAYNADYGVSFDEAQKWQNIANVSMGISIGCGVFFTYELVRYLIAANSVIPKNARKVNKKELAVIKNMEAQNQNIQETEE